MLNFTIHADHGCNLVMLWSPLKNRTPENNPFIISSSCFFYRKVMNMPIHYVVTYMKKMLDIEL